MFSVTRTRVISKDEGHAWVQFDGRCHELPLLIGVSGVLPADVARQLLAQLQEAYPS